MTAAKLRRAREEVRTRRIHKGMSDRYRNIFSHYRGPAHSKEADKRGALENNVTKALLNTLDLCEDLGSQFIEWLSDKLYERYGLRLEPPEIEDIRILEGPTDQEKKGKALKIMLGIMKYNGRCVPGTPGKGRVDGTILGQQWLVAVESKLDDMYMRQFRKEKKMLGAETDLIICWRDIHDFFCGLDEKQCAPTDRLFVKQFTDYMKAIGQIPFQGIKKRHFEFFTKDRGEQEVERIELRGLLNTLGADLWDYRDKNAELRQLYRGGWDWVRGLNKNSKLDHAELRFYLLSRRGTDNQCYLGIRIDSEYPDILSVYACLGTERMLGRLRKTLKLHKNQLCQILKDDNLGGYTMQLHDDNGICSYEQILPKRRDGRIIRSYLLELERAVLTARYGRDMYFALTVDFEKDTIVSLPDERQLGKIAEAMKALHPFMQFLNDVR